MAPWSRNRANKASEKDLKQKAKAQDERSETPPLPVVRAMDDAADSVQSSPRRTHRTRDSVVSLSAVHDTPSTFSPNPALLDIPETIGRNQAKRFSLLKFRHASDSQLSRTARAQAQDFPPVPRQFDPPSIIATAPTSDMNTTSKRKSTLLFARRNRDGNVKNLFSPDLSGTAAFENARRTFDEAGRPSGSSAPPPYGDESGSSLAIPTYRASESDASSGEHGVFATTTTTHTVSTTTTFFKLPRRKKDKGPLFPLPPKAISANASLGGTPRLSGVESGMVSPGHYFDKQPEYSMDGDSPRKSRMLGFGATNRSSSRGSHGSARVSSTLARNSGLDLRGRSSTMGSAAKRSFLEEDWNMPTPPLPQSTRTSTSTAGRPSLAGLFNLNRIRQSSEPYGRASHGGLDTPTLMENRAPPIVIPERQEGDTAAKYLARLEEVVHRAALVAIVSKTDDDFMKHVLRSFMRRFSFFEDPLDMAVRKLLMHIDLPKETQQIDRTLQAFADRYHECNPGVFPDSDHAYFCAFSIVILHTDAFNKNNKRKMQKPDYIKNAREQSGVAPEVLDCFYDNIVYTPFIHLEDDVAIPKQQHKVGKRGHKGPTTPSKKSSGPIDPYTVILDGKLDSLRPDLDGILSMEDPFNCTGTVSNINVAELNKTFMKYGILQIISTRSRPDAFMTQATISNPSEAQMGVVDMKVTKAGILWRKDPKKKKTRSPWQEWGAILTASQLYLFRNPSWAKTLMHQYEGHSKTKAGTAVVFKPALEQFRPDFSLPMDEVVALIDSEYRKHKNAFFFTRSTAFQEVFLADNESELNDWIAKINFAAAYRTAGVRMRAVIGSESQVQTVKRPESPSPLSADDNQNLKPLPIEVKHNANLERQVMEARTQIMQAKLKDALKHKETLEKNVQSLLRLSRQMCVLTPIQGKTKETIIEGTIRLAANIRWTRIELWRVQCHHDILQADLDLDKEKSLDEESPVANGQQDGASQPVKEEKGRLGFARLGSRAGSGNNTSAKQIRPPQHPAGRQLFSMDDIFRSPSRTRQSQHKAKGSWELPPLSFDRGRSVSSSRASRRSSEVMMERVRSHRSDSVPAQSESSRSVAVESEQLDDDHQALVDAGILPADEKSIEVDTKVEAEEEDKAKVPELDEKETSKVRHSFQNKLQKAQAHIPTPSRSKKHRDSTASSVLSDESGSVDGEGGLARGPGKFTVHGKKASVVTFGADWADMTAEESMKARKSQHEDDLRAGQGLVEIPTSIQETGLGSTRSSSPSTIRDDSVGFVTPTEESFPNEDAVTTPKAKVDKEFLHASTNSTPKAKGDLIDDDDDSDEDDE